jgi:hypothetical protein
MIGKWVIIDKATKIQYLGYYDSEGDAEFAVRNGAITVSGGTGCDRVLLSEVSIIQLQNPFPNSKPLEPKEEVLISDGNTRMFLFDNCYCPSKSAIGGYLLVMEFNEDTAIKRAGVLLPIREGGRTVLTSLPPEKMTTVLANIVLVLSTKLADTGDK